MDLLAELWRGAGRQGDVALRVDVAEVRRTGARRRPLAELREAHAHRRLLPLDQGLGDGRCEGVGGAAVARDAPQAHHLR